MGKPTQTKLVSKTDQAADKNENMGNIAASFSSINPIITNHIQKQSKLAHECIDIDIECHELSSNDEDIIFLSQTNGKHECVVGNCDKIFRNSNALLKHCFKRHWLIKQSYQSMVREKDVNGGKGK